MNAFILLHIVFVIIGLFYIKIAFSLVLISRDKDIAAHQKIIHNPIITFAAACTVVPILNIIFAFWGTIELFRICNNENYPVSKIIKDAYSVSMLDLID